MTISNTLVGERTPAGARPHAECGGRGNRPDPVQGQGADREPASLRRRRSKRRTRIRSTPPCRFIPAPTPFSRATSRACRTTRRTRSIGSDWSRAASVRSARSCSQRLRRFRTPPLDKRHQAASRHMGRHRGRRRRRAERIRERGRCDHSRRAATSGVGRRSDDRPVLPAGRGAGAACARPQAQGASRRMTATMRGAGSMKFVK